MGRPLVSIVAALPAEHQEVLQAYEAALRAAGTRDTLFFCARTGRAVASGGASSLGNRLRFARRFLRQLGMEWWQGLALDEQIDLLAARDRNPRAFGFRTFAFWLALTGRRPFPRSLLEAFEARGPSSIHWLEHGRLAWPDLMGHLRETALKLGFTQGTAGDVGRAVTKAAAFLGKQPQALSLAELVDLSDAMQERRAQWRDQHAKRGRGHGHQPLNPWTTGSVLYHAGLLPEPPSTELIGRYARQNLQESQLGYLRDRWPLFYDVATRYLAQRGALRSAATVKGETLALGEFFRWLTTHHPALTDLRQLDRRTHIEPFLRFVLEEAGRGRARGQQRWTRATQSGALLRLRRFFQLIAYWEWPEAPTRHLLLPGDFPKLPEPLPKAFDDVDAARMVHLARTAATPLERLVIELLASCGLRRGEARELKLSDLVAFGAGDSQPTAHAWLRIPLGKLANDRYVPVGPELQAALDAFLAAERSSREWQGLATPPEWTVYLLARKGRRVSTAYCNQVVQRIARRAGVPNAHAHRWRHTFATQAINRGMDLASIATLLGHRTLEMTMVYARIASPALRHEFERISQQVQAFYAAVGQDSELADGPVALPPGTLGPAMTVARREMEWRRLGNGWCTRRAYLDCRYELVCERCIHFNTDRLFLPILQAQAEDARRKGQQARIEILTKLVVALEQAESADAVLPAVSGPAEADFSNQSLDPSKGALA